MHPYSLSVCNNENNNFCSDEQTTSNNPHDNKELVILSKQILSETQKDTQEGINLYTKTKKGKHSQPAQ